MIGLKNNKETITKEVRNLKRLAEKGNLCIVNGESNQVKASGQENKEDRRQ